MALFVCLVVMAVGLAVMYAMVEGTRNNLRRTNDSEVLDQNYFAAKGVTELALTVIWGGFSNSGSVNFQQYLDSRFSWTVVTPGTTGWILTDFAANYPKVPNTLSNPVFKLATPTQWDNLRFSNALISQVRLYRADRGMDRNNPNQVVTDVLLVVEAQRDLGYGSPSAQRTTASASQQTLDGGAVSYSQLFTFSNPPLFNGLDFALLTKNIGCSCCHMQVDNLARVMNKDPRNYGTYERVKVGTTQSLTMRPGSAATLIEGTLYQRGTLAEEGVGPMSVKTLSTSGNMTMVKFQANSTAVYENSSGVATAVAPNNATTDSSYNPITGAPAARRNTYLNYSTTTALQTDGNLPTPDDFPAPFVDGNNNRKVDRTYPDDEVSAAKADIQGIATSLTGGIGVKLSAGALYTGTALPTAGTASINATGAVGAGSDNGNFVFVGTQSNPIQLDGKVVIDGDVMLSGYVQGSGQIWATGNIYIPGDVRYADTTDSNGEVFGVNTQGRPNLLGVVAGGNIIVGDYLSQVNDWQSSQANFFTIPATPDPGRWTDTAKLSTGNWLDGQSAPHNADGTINVTQDATVTTNRNNPFANFVNEELSIFNRNEFQKTLLSMPEKPSSGNMDITSPATYTLTNPLLDTNYVPRYYSMYSANAVAAFGSSFTQNAELNVFSGYNYKNSSGSSTTETGTYWDSTNQQWAPKGDPHCYGWITDLTKIPASVQTATAVSKKVVLNIHPDWISPANMQRLLASTEAVRPDNTPRRLDGLLYTNNAIFCIERQKALNYNTSTGLWSSANSRSRGRMTVNGAIVAPDLGVLVTGNYPYSFVLNYDARVRNFMPMAAKTQKWGMLRKGCSRSVGALPAM